MLNNMLNNAEIADRLLSLAQLLSAQKENPFKIKAYRRAAKTIKTLSESIHELVSNDADLTQFDGIGKGISGAIREIVLSGTLGQLETPRSQSSPELVALSEYPRLDPKRILRIYKKLGISSVPALAEKLGAGEIALTFGPRMDEHVRQGLSERHDMLLYEAEDTAAAVVKFPLNQCGVRKAEVTGDFRRRVEVLGEISFLVETDDFQAVRSKAVHYGGEAVLLSSGDGSAVLRLSSGVIVRIQAAPRDKWGLGLNPGYRLGRPSALPASHRGRPGLTREIVRPLPDREGGVPASRPIFHRTGTSRRHR